MFKYYLPIVMVSLGLYLEGMYTLLSLLSSLIGLVMGVAYGRLKLKDRGSEENAELGMIGDGKVGPRKVSLRRSVKKRCAVRSQDNPKTS